MTNCSTTSRRSGPQETNAYAPFVELCNKVLLVARRKKFAAKIDEHLLPQDPKNAIEFIRYNSLSAEYDWTDGLGKPCSSTVEPDILIVRKDGIKEYKTDQARGRNEKFDPGAAPASETPRKCRVKMKDILSFVELKWTAKAAAAALTGK